MKCESYKQATYESGSIECALCKTANLHLEALESKYREALRHRVASEGTIAELKKENLYIHRQAVKQRNVYVLTILLLFFLSFFLLLRRKQDSVPITTLKKYADSLEYYKTGLYALQNSRTHSLKYIIGNKENNGSIGGILFSDPKIGYKILKDNGLDTNKWNLKRLRVGDTIIFNFK